MMFYMDSFNIQIHFIILMNECVSFSNQKLPCILNVMHISFLLPHKFVQCLEQIIDEALYKNKLLLLLLLNDILIAVNYISSESKCSKII